MNTLENIEKVAKSIIDICNKKKITKPDKDKIIEYQKEIADLLDELMECDNCEIVTDSIATITLNGVTANLCQDCGIQALKEGKIEQKIKLFENENSEEELVEENNNLSSKEILRIELKQIPRLPGNVIEKLVKKYENLQEIVNAPIEEIQDIEGIGENRALTIKKEFEDAISNKDNDNSSNNNDEKSEENKQPQIDWDELYNKIQDKTALKKNEVKHIHKLIDEIALPMELENTIKYVNAEIDMSRLKVDQSDAEAAVKMIMNEFEQ